MLSTRSLGGFFQALTDAAAPATSGLWQQNEKLQGKRHKCRKMTRLSEPNSCPPALGMSWVLQRHHVLNTGSAALARGIK